MAVRHGYKAYAAGCRCDQCKEAHRVYQRRYRERKAAGLTQPVAMVQLPTGGNPTVGPVESAVELEVSGLAADARPTLAAVALAMAKILDGQVPTPKPPAAKAARAPKTGKMARMRSRRITNFKTWSSISPARWARVI